MMKVGINLFTVRNSMAQNPVKTMEALAEMGYKHWETFSVMGPDGFSARNFGLHMPAVSAGSCRRFLDSLGVTIIGTHLQVPWFYNEKFIAEFLDYQAEIGCVSPGHTGGFFISVDDIKRRCEAINHVAALCHERGMKFHYHNHFNEFQKFDGRHHIDYILEYTDPDLVDFEIDAYWCERGGADPIEMIKKYGKRIKMLHVKDFPANAPEKVNLFEDMYKNDAIYSVQNLIDANPKTFVEIGDGVMDIQGIINAANEYADVDVIQVEQDHSTLAELESAKRSLDNFQKYNGIVKL